MSLHGEGNDDALVISDTMAAAYEEARAAVRGHTVLLDARLTDAGEDRGCPWKQRSAAPAQELECLRTKGDRQVDRNGRIFFAQQRLRPGRVCAGPGNRSASRNSVKISTRSGLSESRFLRKLELMALPAGRRLSFENSIRTRFVSAAAPLVASVRITTETSHGTARRRSSRSRRSASRARPMCLPDRSATALSEAALTFLASALKAFRHAGWR